MAHITSRPGRAGEPASGTRPDWALERFMIAIPIRSGSAEPGGGRGELLQAGEGARARRGERGCGTGQAAW